MHTPALLGMSRLKLATVTIGNKLPRVLLKDALVESSAPSLTVCRSPLFESGQESRHVLCRIKVVGIATRHLPVKHVIVGEDNVAACHSL